MRLPRRPPWTIMILQHGSKNLVTSSVLYLAAELFWNVDYDESRGVIFGFMKND